MRLYIAPNAVRRSTEDQLFAAQPSFQRTENNTYTINDSDLANPLIPASIQRGLEARGVQSPPARGGVAKMGVILPHTQTLRGGVPTPRTPPLAGG